MNTKALEAYVVEHSVPSPRGNTWVHTIVSSINIDSEIGAICQKYNLSFVIVNPEEYPEMNLMHVISLYLNDGKLVFVQLHSDISSEVYSDMLNWKEYTIHNTDLPKANTGRLFIIVNGEKNYDYQWKVSRLTDYHFQYE
jgi:hypothetical protein